VLKTLHSVFGENSVATYVTGKLSTANWSRLHGASPSNVVLIASTAAALPDPIRNLKKLAHIGPDVDGLHVTDYLRAQWVKGESKSFRSLYATAPLLPDDYNPIRLYYRPW